MRLGSAVLLATVPALLCGWSRPAAARVVLHQAKPGDTPESLAADYYGNRSLALFIVEANALRPGAPLKPRQKVRIPTAFRYRVRRGDTLDGLAQKFLQDKRRAPFLASFSGLKPGERPREGQELLVPFQHVHTAPAPESVTSLARAFYGDASKAKLLEEFNFRTTPMVAKGEKLLIPIAHVRVRAVRLENPPAAAPSAKPAAAADRARLEAAPAREAERRELALARRVAARLVEAERSYRNGNYPDVPALLDKLLADEDPSEAQLAEIFRLKAFAYVALGEEELAVNAFREVIARQPEVRLDIASVSPKIRAALDRARKVR